MYGNTRSRKRSHNVKENEQKVANIKTVIAHKTNQVFDELVSNLADETTSKKIGEK